MNWEADYGSPLLTSRVAGPKIFQRRKLPSTLHKCEGSSMPCGSPWGESIVPCRYAGSQQLGRKLGSSRFQLALEQRHSAFEKLEDTLRMPYWNLPNSCEY